jgi:hypothetical protein
VEPNPAWLTFRLSPDIHFVTDTAEVRRVLGIREDGHESHCLGKITLMSPAPIGEMILKEYKAREINLVTQTVGGVSGLACLRALAGVGAK